MLYNLIFLILPLCLMCKSCQVYDKDLVNNALLISQQTYCPNTTIVNENVILESVAHKNGDEAIIGFDKKYKSIFVAFRGSDNIFNWLNNIRIVKVNPYRNYPEAGVETGFFNMYKKLDSKIYGDIIKLSIKYNNTNIMITGHSLGAALSTLLAFDVLHDSVYDGFNVHSLITFGSPRVGNKQFSDLVSNITSYRVTHYYDLVPHLPFEFLDYHHVRQEIWYNEDNTDFTECDDKFYEDSSCCNSCGSTDCISIDDHLNYLNITMGSDGC